MTRLSGMTATSVVYSVSPRFFFTRMQRMLWRCKVKKVLMSKGKTEVSGFVMQDVPR